MCKRLWKRFADRRRKVSKTTSDAVVTGLISAGAWLVIERTSTCDRFFAWVAANPDTEADSVILAFILASIGITSFALRRYREMSAAMIKQRFAEERANTLAFHDPLTGLLNRRAINDRLESLSRTGPGNEFALLIIDLDRFKAVNDVHGHLAGDRLLRSVAARIEAGLAVGETVYRLGGDEFALVCEITDGDHDRARRAARLIVQRLAEPFGEEGLVHHIGASVGIAMFPGDAHDRETLMRRADISLYRAKDAGRGQHRSFEAAMDAEITRRSIIEQQLRHAIGDDLLRPYYQPLIDLANGQIAGFELLARWPRTGSDEIAPDQFIPIAEESGLINELMMKLLERACIEARDWDPKLTIAINISPVQLRDPWLSQKVLAVLAKGGFSPKRLAVEITENALIADAENARRTVESFKNQGMTIGLDDFGTGYSSLHHLRVLPFDKLKIDRSFVQAIETDHESLMIVRAIVSLAMSLNLPVIAEGIESASIAEKLRQMGCAQGQGFHFGRALSGEAISRILNGPPSHRWTEEASVAASAAQASFIKRRLG
jgi:diguanylate cyclase (GGDEF)-like protein